MYADLARPPLSERSLRTGLVHDGSLWTDVRVVASTGSTNADLLAAARAGAAEGLVLVAEAQSAGRGRLDRAWTAPPRAGLTASVLLRPDVPAARRGWLPLLAGVALAAAVSRLADVPVRVKWPNDLLVPAAGADARPGKVAGILAEAVADAVVLGFGLNVTTNAAELPGPAATSLALAGSACLDRDPLLRAALRALETDYLAWADAGGDPERSGLRARYLAGCDTVGRAVRVALPGDRTVTGRAVDVDGDGCLVVDSGTGMVAVAAGDVVHVR